MKSGRCRRISPLTPAARHGDRGGQGGFAGDDFEEFLAGPDLDLTLIRPARMNEKNPRSIPDCLRQRAEAIIWTLRHQPGLERHGGRVPAGLRARIVQRLPALNAVIWHNWQIGAPVKRSLIASAQPWRPASWAASILPAGCLVTTSATWTGQPPD